MSLWYSIVAGSAVSPPNWVRDEWPTNSQSQRWRGKIFVQFVWNFSKFFEILHFRKTGVCHRTYTTNSSETSQSLNFSCFGPWRQLDIDNKYIIIITNHRNLSDRTSVASTSKNNRYLRWPTGKVKTNATTTTTPEEESLKENFSGTDKLSSEDDLKQSSAIDLYDRKNHNYSQRWRTEQLVLNWWQVSHGRKTFGWRSNNCEFTKSNPKWK